MQWLMKNLKHGPFFIYTHKFSPVCHSGLDPESSVFLDSRFRGNDEPCFY